jgi:hypothetical protein
LFACLGWFYAEPWALVDIDLCGLRHGV